VSVRETLSETGDRLRQAIAGRLYGKADALLGEYRRALESLPAEAPEREAILKEAAGLLESARRMTLAARAAAAAQLIALPRRAAPYPAPPAPARHTWEMMG
jgi:hypothetical protein